MGKVMPAKGWSVGRSWALIGRSLTLPGRGLLASLTAHAANAGPAAWGTGGTGGSHHHVAAARGAADAGGDSRGSTGDAEIATDDATAGAADAWGELGSRERKNRCQALPLPRA